MLGPGPALQAPESVVTVVQDAVCADAGRVCRVRRAYRRPSEAYEEELRSLVRAQTEASASRRIPHKLVHRVLDSVRDELVAWRPGPEIGSAA